MNKRIRTGRLGGCPKCGSQSVQWIETVEDPIDGVLYRYSCRSCWNWWDEPEDQDSFRLFIDADFDTFAAFDLGAAAQVRYLEMTAA